MYKELLAAIAILLTFAMYLPYIHSIRAGKTKPHVFSWITWTLNSSVVFFAQLTGHGGYGAWPIGVSSLLTAYTAFLAYRHRSDTAITKTDWIFLTVAATALLCWLLTSNPLLTVALLTAVELAGFGPTFRSAFARPHEERSGFFLLGLTRNTLAIAALEHYSLTTILYPAAKCVVGILLIVVIWYRRKR